MSDERGSSGVRLNAMLSESGIPHLNHELIERFERYITLILRWNARINLTAIRDEDGVLRRHFVESIACAQVLPPGIETLLDFGSGAGFPGIPIALCRPEIAVTLAESQGKKAAFLCEAARVLPAPVTVWSERAEGIARQFDCVALRAVDRMADAVTSASKLVKRNGWLALMTTSTEVADLQGAAAGDFIWQQQIPLPGGDLRVVALGRRNAIEP